MGTTIDGLQAEIDSMLQRRKSSGIRGVRRLEISDTNIQKIFGVTMEQLFYIIAKKLGYEITQE